MIAPLLLVVALILPPQDQYVTSRYGMCPDGQVLEQQLYDPDPKDNGAIIVVYKRGDHVLAVLDSRTKQIRLANGQTLTIDQAQERYGSPCNLPDGTGV